MLPSPSFTSLRSSAINEFNTLRSRASRNFWLAKLFNRNNSPRSFVTTNATGLHAKRLAGVQSIPVDKIVGTIQRTNDFDKDFRPLKAHLRDRWVNALLLFQTDGWEPIVVHKLGEFYYVNDGHHRVSVAKATGMVFMDAEVWDHPLYKGPCEDCPARQEPVKRRAQAYSTNS